MEISPASLRSSVALKGDRQREQRISQFFSLSAIVILGRLGRRPPADIPVVQTPGMYALRSSVAPESDRQ
ncbi:hypothetical protein ACIP6X_34050 [Streptomyces coeruleorubidus]|uniref:hypothetical protein n=1 Tax=Streptomyces coeruleorubidus TaxID=116188 RepID=UPI00380D876C